jgi:hypothetical protein
MWDEGSIVDEAFGDCRLGNVNIQFTSMLHMGS